VRQAGPILHGARSSRLSGLRPASMAYLGTDARARRHIARRVYAIPEARRHTNQIPAETAEGSAPTLSKTRYTHSRWDADVW